MTSAAAQCRAHSCSKQLRKECASSDPEGERSGPPEEYPQLLQSRDPLSENQWGWPAGADLASGLSMKLLVQEFKFD
jgi:hypothetical protein